MERGKNKVEWQELSECRLRDAEVLLENKRYAAAYYLAGYGVECALKARVASLMREGDFPPKPKFVREELYTHSLVKLLVASDLLPVFEEKFKSNPSFEDQWKAVQDWSEESRYEDHDERTATEILNSAKEVVKCIERYWESERSKTDKN